jgi:transposase
MKTNTVNPPDPPISDRELIRRLTEKNHQQSLEIEYLKERIDLLLAQVYGKKSEKHPLELPDQISYLEDLPEEPIEAPPVEEIPIPAHTRSKKGRKPLPEELPRIEVIHDLSEEEKQCACGSSLTCIGQEVSEQLDYVPAKLQVIRHIRLKYACKACEGLESEESTVKIAPVPRQFIEKSIASAGLLAHLFSAKFVDAMPYYRQEKQLSRLGYKLSRTNMANWTIQAGFKLLKLLELLRHELLSGPLIHMDETTIQVLKEPDRSPQSKSYMWVLRNGASEKPGILFHYSPTRASTVVRELLTSYRGIVQTDGYCAYDYLDESDEVQHANCWAHSRRKFVEVLKAKGDYQKKKAKTGHAEEAIDFIRQLYAIEQQADKEELSDLERVARRDEKSKPVLEKFHKWLKKLSLKTPPKGLLGKAVNYTLERWKQLTFFVNHGFLPLDNNSAENAIRPFVVGRKNWLFNDTVEGAKASAALYSLIETARANGLNPYNYLKMLFEKFPFVETDEELKALLPQYQVPTPLGKKQDAV